ncbi:hypothetical protein PV327_002521 [Microctonus hyperodae]|uniref:Nuclear receptor 2C2-associated protein n=1 Tax=Microctonus hyperodae TaxID=165561 RepID=A0AA39FG25_MICHY|nr:hypothetical protein PV327_002521 [Microctonus hyperodae]
MQNLLKENSFDCRVSSVLNKDVKSYGKKYMFDGNDETCWNSESGIPQWILLKFEQEQTIGIIEIQFQGGFAGKYCHLEAGSDSQDLKQSYEFYPEDTNSIQRFKLDKPVKGKTFKIVLNSSTDFFGRVIIYNLSLYT